MHSFKQERASWDKNTESRINGGWYYTNEVWFSPAYTSLTISSRNLLQCFLSELRWTGKGKKRQYLNNGEISYTEIAFKKRFRSTSSTYIKARNQLIEVGFIKQVYRGGMCRGDMSKYKLFLLPNMPKNEQRWRRYPDENWENEIPKQKKQLVGVKTQWKAGKSGRKAKPTLVENTLNGTIHPNE